MKFLKKKESPILEILKKKFVLKLLTHNNCVISLGGGSIINKKIRKAIKKNSYSIYLQVKIKQFSK